MAKQNDFVDNNYSGLKLMQKHETVIICRVNYYISILLQTKLVRTSFTECAVETKFQLLNFIVMTKIYF